MQFFRTTLLAVLLLAFIPAAYAQNNDEGPYVRIRLVPERGMVKPGEEIGLAIEQSIAPGWHTYWKNPGDSGASPRVKWTLPDGFGTSEIEWPVPHKLPYGPLLNYGYEDNVILLQKLKAPENIADGPITLKADIDVLVCKEICIPETGTYEITLNGTESASEDNAAYFENARNKLPSISAAEGIFYERDGTLILEKPIDWAHDVARFQFIPEDWGAIENNSDSDITQTDGKLIIKHKRGQRSLDELDALRGLIIWQETLDSEPKAYAFTARPGDAPAAAQSVTAEPPPALIFILFCALLGGIILNLMPCVFPVLSIKAISLVQIAQKEPKKAQIHGLAYTAGVMLSFLFIASLLLILKAGGAQIGWGFQLQSPEIVTLLAWLLFVVGLNLSGIFEIRAQFGNFGNRLTQGNTPGHSFFTGVLATLVATPCTAPFMGVALGFALLQPAYISLIVFAVLGLGLALPYLALSFIPSLQKILPKPGAWMDTFKQLLAFPMYASAAWLVWVLSQQSGPMGVFSALMGIVLIAFGIWCLRHMPTTKLWHNIVRILAIIAFIIALMIIPGGTQHGKMPMPENTFGELWSPAKLSETLESSHPVFVEMTAAWCITCKVNHAIAINTNQTRKVFADNAVQYLVGDWTNQDPEITKYLNQFGRTGVPIYVYYGARDANGTRPEPVVLPQILTPGIVSKAVTGN